ncbi:uncharacterized protein BCR38DRAFT_481598 [Pseudomassariella vexata]|uniref:F-box domain-containing protein n=1 Tax=Pseudomassariella vexata TaxID=1141098 RepID=A0A1Y2EFV9_9PEZI|nr:uncharacterized protein BCR38DRAFT_481598 [Pseudomassariella vexata]ORY70462.1 hypothetical protein BCR38DRAFT_481598 [Pseudomassariella vexata]
MAPVFGDRAEANEPDALSSTTNPIKNFSASMSLTSTSTTSHDSIKTGLSTSEKSHSKAEGTSKITKLPTELSLAIILYLTPSDALSLALTSKRFNSIITRYETTITHALVINHCEERLLKGAIAHHALEIAPWLLFKSTARDEAEYLQIIENFVKEYMNKSCKGSLPEKLRLRAAIRIAMFHDLAITTPWDEVLHLTYREMRKYYRRSLELHFEIVGHFNFQMHMHLFDMLFHITALRYLRTPHGPGNRAFRITIRRVLTFYTAAPMYKRIDHRVTSLSRELFSTHRRTRGNFGGLSEIPFLTIVARCKWQAQLGDIKLLRLGPRIRRSAYSAQHEGIVH